MKRIILFSLLTISCFAFGQKVKLKDDILFIDSKECMHYSSKQLGTKNVFSSLDGKALFFIDFISTGKYVKISFTDSDEIATIQSNVTRKKIIEQFLELGLIKDCTFFPEKIKNYIKRYDQKYEQSIIRYSN